MDGQQTGFDGTTRFSDHLPLADGTRLAYDLILPTVAGRPSERPLSTLFKYTPYLRAYTIRGEQEKSRVAELYRMPPAQRAALQDLDLFDPRHLTGWLSGLVQHGYAAIVVERPGTGASFGTMDPTLQATAREANQVLRAGDGRRHGEVMRPSMLTTRTTATVIGVLFLAADAAGAGGRLVGGRLVSAAPVDVAALQAHGNRVVAAALLTLLMGVLLALIPVVGFPVFRRHDEVLATGYLVFRGALEMIGYAATAFVWLAMASVPADPGGSGVINTLAKLPDAAITPYVDVIFALAALTLSWLLLRARLVPGWLAIWGLAGGALYLAQGAAAAFGSGWGPLIIPLAVQEITLAVWLIVKGFTEHIAAEADREREPQLAR